MEGNMLGEGGLLVQKSPDLPACGSLQTGDNKTQEVVDPLVFEPGAEGSLQFMDHQAAKTIGAHTGAPG